MMTTVVDDMAPSFLRHGIVIKAWTFENDAVPGATPLGGSIQTVIDGQLPRRSDGSIAYDLYVGILNRRIGTPLKDAPSGTVHEFREAHQSFEASGRPHILFYFREREPGPTTDPQQQAVDSFRAQYPGLFARYGSVEDLEAQFRRHLLTELLDVFRAPPAVEPVETAGAAWFDSMAAAYGNLTRNYPDGFFDNSPARIQRILHQVHLLFGSETSLTRDELKIISGALFSLLLRDSDRAEFARLVAGETTEIASAIHAVVARVVGEAAPVGLGGKQRLDLLAALVTIASRLDLTKSAIASDGGLSATRNVDEWLAMLTSDIECERGIVRWNLIAPSDRWVQPLIGATALSMEALWQRNRSVLTKYGFSFAVARSRIELDPDLEPDFGVALDLVRKRAQEAAESLPAQPHLGDKNLPEMGNLLPLPSSVVLAPVLFRAPMPGTLRLIVNGKIATEPSDASVIEYLPPVGDSAECILECDEAGEYVSVVKSRLRRASPAEMVFFDCAPEKREAMRSLGLWDELLAEVWPGISSSEPNQEDLSTAFHVIRNAFLEISSETGTLLARRDLYWDAMETIRKMLVRQLCVSDRHG